MRTCLYCHKEIRDKPEDTIYCTRICGAKYRAMLDIYEDYNGLPTGKHKATKRFSEATKALQEHRETTRWGRIGFSSSYEAMMEVYNMFK